MKINFDQQICGNFNLAANKEWLEVNKLGGYAASTIYGLNNRRYHGLFVIPCGPEQSRTILLSKFEESIIIHNHVYELSTNQFTGGIYPDGFKYIKNFSIDPFPKVLFEIENRRFEKSFFLRHHQHTLIIRYTSKDQGPTFNLVLKPMLAARKIDNLTHEISNFNIDSYLKDGVVKFTPLESLPELKIYYQKGEYIPAPLWYHNYIYEMDSRRRQGAPRTNTEDLLNPGFFSVRLEPYESFDLFISVDQVTNFDYESISREEKEYRRRFDPAVKNFDPIVQDLSKKIELLTIENKAGFPLRLSDYPNDENDSGRILFSLFGLAIHDHIQTDLTKAMLDLADKINKRLLPLTITKRENTDVSTYLFADLPLIFIYLVYYLYDFRLTQKFIEDHLLSLCLEIIDVYCKGNTAYISQDKDGLLLTGDRNTESSWLISRKVSDQSCRFGKLCEINTLWYNALMITEFLCRKTAKKKQAKKIAAIAEKVKKSFNELFWNPKLLRYADHIAAGEQDMTFSLTQLFLVGLPFSMLDTDRGIYVIRQIEKDLLTKFGFRSLSPHSEYYKGRLSSHMKSTDPSYSAGAIWPWMFGIYVDAVLAFRGTSAQVIDGLYKSLKTLTEFFTQQGLGNISEYFEGNPPHRRNGQICSALNLTELLRSYRTIHQARKEREGFSEYT